MKKMKKLRIIFIICLAIGILESCSTIYPVTATNNPIGSKTGKSTTTILFGAATGANLGTGLVLNKDYGVIEAARKASIEKVGTVDIKVTNYYLFQKAEIIVTGE